MLRTTQLRVNAPGVIGEVLDGEAIIVNLESGAYYSLDGAGADVWRAAQPGASLEEMIGLVLARFSGEPAEIAAGVTTLVEDLVAQGLLVVDRAAEVSTSPLQPTVGGQASERPPFTQPMLRMFTDMADLLLLDPIHEVDEQGWPHRGPGS